MHAHISPLLIPISDPRVTLSPLHCKTLQLRLKKRIIIFFKHENPLSLAWYGSRTFLKKLPCLFLCLASDTKTCWSNKTAFCLSTQSCSCRQSVSTDFFYSSLVGVEGGEWVDFLLWDCTDEQLKAAFLRLPLPLYSYRQRRLDGLYGSETPSLLWIPIKQTKHFINPRSLNEMSPTQLTFVLPKHCSEL